MPTKNKPFFFLCLSMVFFVFACTYPTAEAEGRPGEEPLVRVALLKEANTIRCTTSENYRLVYLQGERLLEVSGPGDKWQFEYVNGLLRVSKNSVTLGEFGGPLAFKATGHTLYLASGITGLDGVQRCVADDLVVSNSKGRMEKLDMGKGVYVRDSRGLHEIAPTSNLNLFSLGFEGIKKYRGNMYFYPEARGITLVNELNVEDYLYGVIPNEMPSEWPLEALKAQAVASRSYLLAEKAKNQYNYYDLLATEQSQVYGGYSTETENTNKAVRDTAGEVLVCQGNYVQAFFHSSSGGFIEASSEVWLEQLPYTMPKEDPYDYNDRHYGWVAHYTNGQLTDQVNLKLDAMGYGVKFAVLEDINALEYTATGARIKKMSFAGVDGSGIPLYFEINTADRVRALLGLKSACFRFNKEFGGDNRLTAVTFYGDGNGHGLGMSQYGARGMALEGNNYREILQYYYHNVEQVPNYARGKGYTGEGF